MYKPVVDQTVHHQRFLNLNAMVGCEGRDASEDGNVDPAAYKNFEEMPRRVDPQMVVVRRTSPQAAYPYAPSNKSYDHSGRPSPPPPIATFPAHASPSPPSNASSIDSSSVSTPLVGNPDPRLPLPSQPHQQRHQHALLPPPPQYAYDILHFPSGNYVYGPPQPQPPQYAHHPHAQHPHEDQHRSNPNAHQQSQPQNAQPQYAPPYGSYAPYPPPGTAPSAPTGWSSQNGGAGAGINIVYTDDASTKPSDQVRRRCFNCCTTETAAWRRSTLNPGKMLCNKCGLFERVHSRARPEKPVLKPAHSRSQPDKSPLAPSTSRSKQQQSKQTYQPYQPSPPPNASESTPQQQSQSHPAPYPYPAPMTALAGPSISTSTSISTSASHDNHDAAPRNCTPTSAHDQQHQNGDMHPAAANGSGNGNKAANANANDASEFGSRGPDVDVDVDVDFLRAALSAERGTSSD